MARVLKSRVGEIILGFNSIREVASVIDELNPHKVAVVTDSIVKEIWMNELIKHIEGVKPMEIVIDGRRGEEEKNINTVISSWRKLLESGFTRKSLIIGFGGGVVCDLAAFIASTYMRGTQLILIPTTLLAQIDAAIGGKTGVDFEGKNIIGTFYPPSHVIIDPALLRTLPRTEVLNGLSEAVKYGVIRDRELFELIEEEREELTSIKKRLIEVIERCVSIKVDVVERDFREEGLRRILNFGHTIGHAIEKATNYRIKHGFAISIGMAANCLLAEELTGFSHEEATRVIELLKEIGLPINLSINPARVLSAMEVDKKAWYGKPVLILPLSIGEVTILEVEAKKILGVLSELHEGMRSSKA